MSILDGLSPAARNLAQQVQSIFGAQNVTFTSGRRDHIPPGGSKTSQHFSGNAFDFQVKGMDPLRVQEKIAAAGVSYGQSIAEYGLGMGPRNHLGVGTKGENLVARDGRYSPVKLNSNVRDYAKRFLDDSLVDLFFGAKDVATGDKSIGEAVTEAVTPDWNGWFGRITIALFALLLLAAALFMLRPSALPSIPGVKK